MKWLWFLLAVFLVGLHYRLWVGEGSLAEVWGLNQKIEELETHNAALRERNDSLKAEVGDLKQGLDAIEERARNELGMIKEGETFYQMIEVETAAQQERTGK